MGVLRKSGSWYIDYRADGGRLREKIGSSKVLAEKVLAKRLAEIAEGKFLDRKKIEKRYLFREAAEKFLEYSRAFLPDGRSFVIVLLSKEIGDTGKTQRAFGEVSRMVYDELLHAR